KARSNSADFGPVVSQPLLRVAATSAISSSPTRGGANGRKFCRAARGRRAWVSRGPSSSGRKTPMPLLSNPTGRPSATRQRVRGGTRHGLPREQALKEPPSIAKMEREQHERQQQCPGIPLPHRHVDCCNVTSDQVGCDRQRAERHRGRRSSNG